MEVTMDITSNGSNNNSNDTAVAGAAPHNQQQVQEEAVVSSPTGMEQAKNTIKKPRGAAQQAGGSGEPKPRPPHDPALSCPRCFSTNTKFCYYNNYNLNQPRYSCKTCRRYWTQGGSLRHIPVGGGFRRNKRASGSSSSSSSAASSNAATSAVVNKAVNTQLRLSSSAMSMPAASPTTGLLHNDVVLPAFTPPTDGSGGSDLAMDEQQEEGFLPFEPLSLSDQAPEELAPGESDGTMPTFLDMLTGGYLDGAGSSNSYGADPAMSGACNGMDMSFLLPEVGVSATDPMQMQMLEGMNMNDVAGELQWASSELDNYFNYDGGYYYDPAGPTAGVEQQQQQQVVGDQQQQEEEENKETKNSKNNNDGDGGSSVYSYWINTNNGSDGAQG